METQQQSALKPPEDEEGEEVVFIKLLEERLVIHDENRKAVQDKIHEVCGELHAKIDKLEERINKELEEKFIHEDNRLQTALNNLHENDPDIILQKVKAELLVFQSYEIIENRKFNIDFSTLYKLETEKRIRECLCRFHLFSLDEERALSDHNIVNQVRFRCLLFKKNNERGSKEEYSLYKNEGNGSFTFAQGALDPGTTYGIRVRMIAGDRENEWSDNVAEFIPEFQGCCKWGKCPDYINAKRKYSVDERNPRIASKFNNDGCYCTIIGNMHVPPNAVTSWNIKILESKDKGHFIYIGVAPNDINQDIKNCNESGWYFHYWSSVLCSGPPHNYDGRLYGPRKENSEYVLTRNSIGVVMDTIKGDLSFILDRVNYGVAYKGITLDKPLVPCVLKHERDSVKLII